LERPWRTAPAWPDRPARRRPRHRTKHEEMPFRAGPLHLQWPEPTLEVGSRGPATDIAALRAREQMNVAATEIAVSWPSSNSRRHSAPSQ
jgi:hypothetical protein